jgi:hypothetical protein
MKIKQTILDLSKPLNVSTGKRLESNKGVYLLPEEDSNRSRLIRMLKTKVIPRPNKPTQPIAPLNLNSKSFVEKNPLRDLLTQKYRKIIGTYESKENSLQGEASKKRKEMYQTFLKQSGPIKKGPLEGRYKPPEILLNKVRPRDTSKGSRSSTRTQNLNYSNGGIGGVSVRTGLLRPKATPVSNKSTLYSKLEGRTRVRTEGNTGWTKPEKPGQRRENESSMSGAGVEEELFEAKYHMIYNENEQDSKELGTEFKLHAIVSALKIEVSYLRTHWTDIQTVLKQDYSDIYFLNDFDLFLKLHCFVVLHLSELGDLPFCFDHRDDQVDEARPFNIYMKRSDRELQQQKSHLETLDVQKYVDRVLVIYFKSLEGFIGSNVIDYDRLVEQFCLILNKLDFDRRLLTPLLAAFSQLFQQSLEFAYLISVENKRKIIELFFGHWNRLLEHNLSFFKGEPLVYIDLNARVIELNKTMDCITRQSKSLSLVLSSPGVVSGFITLFENLKEYAFNHASFLSCTKDLNLFLCDVFSALFCLMKSPVLLGVIRSCTSPDDDLQPIELYQTLYLQFLSFLQTQGLERLEDSFPNCIFLFTCLHKHLQVFGDQGFTYDEYLLKESAIMIHRYLKISLDQKCKSPIQHFKLVVKVSECFLQFLENELRTQLNVEKYAFLHLHFSKFIKQVQASLKHLTMKQETNALIQIFSQIKSKFEFSF